MKDHVVVVGDGGHARVVLDILRDADDVNIVGYTSLEGRPETICECPCVGTDAVLEELQRAGVQCGFVAIGGNERRMGLLRFLKEKGFRLVNAISRRAYVSTYATIGLGIAVMPGAVVNAGARLGDGAIVNTNACVDHDCVVGECSHVGPGAVVAGGVRIGQGAFLGAGCAIVPKIIIGDWTTVGAGAVVVRNLPPHIVAFGVPAMVRRPENLRAERE